MRFSPRVHTLTARLVCAAALGVLLASTSLAGGWAEDGPAARIPGTAPAESAPRLDALWRDLAANLGPTLTADRRLFLGARTFTAKSCVSMKRADVFPAIDSGGVGTRTVYLWASTRDRRHSPAADFAWQQTVLRGFLERLRAENDALSGQAVRLADQADRLARALRGGAALPEPAAAADALPPNPWPGHCARSLQAALARGNRGAAQMWADELAATTFALADLHRWLGYVVQNDLAMLAFQAQSEGLFRSLDATYQGRYDDDRDASRFPGAYLIDPVLCNLLEIERQAERLYWPPSRYLVRGLAGDLQARRDGVDAAAAAVWMPPDLRGTFVRLREHLAPRNRRLWDQAAASPYDRSYLANMLFRLSEANVLDAVEVVLERFNRSNPAPTQHALMGVLFYRGGEPGGAVYQWEDRFDPRLVSSAGALGPSNGAALLAAQRFTWGQFDGWDSYESVNSLQAALTTRHMDCVTATDMVGSLFRNAGRAGYYSIRLSSGLVGHSLAAAEVATADGAAIATADGLGPPQDSARFWPDAFFNGWQWPEWWQGQRYDMYTAELYARGLDNYVWVEGYVIRGPNAGTLVRASVPYLPNRAPAATVRVFEPPRVRPARATDG